MKIRDMNISARAKSCLIRDGYTDSAEIENYTEQDLIAIKNINLKCVKEILLEMKNVHDAKADDRERDYSKKKDNSNDDKSDNECNSLISRDDGLCGSWDINSDVYQKWTIGYGDTIQIDEYMKIVFQGLISGKELSFNFEIMNESEERYEFRVLGIIINGYSIDYYGDTSIIIPHNSKRLVELYIDINSLYKIKIKGYNDLKSIRFDIAWNGYAPWNWGEVELSYTPNFLISNKQYDLSCELFELALKEEEREYGYECINEAVLHGYRGKYLYQVAFWYASDDKFVDCFMCLNHLYEANANVTDLDYYDVLAETEFFLGLLYIGGLGTEQNINEGIEMWKNYIVNANDKSCDHLSQVALSFLGLTLKIHSKVDVTIPVDSKMAIECILQHAYHGDETAVSVYEFLKKYGIDLCIPNSYMGVDERLILAAAFMEGYGVIKDCEYGTTLLNELGFDSNQLKA